MKTCNRCGIQKSVSEFGRLSSAADGLNRMCKACNSSRGLVRYYEKREYILERVSVERSNNREHRLSIERASRERNKEKNRARKNERQSIRNRIIQSKRFTVTDRDLNRVLSSPCFACGATTKQSIEHIVPVTRGGTHSAGNLLTLCLPCNLSKGARFLTEWKRDKHLVFEGM